MKRKKIYKITLISIALLLVWGLIWSCNVTRIVKKNSKDNSMANQQATVRNIIVTETLNEKKYWEFYAKSGEYNSEHNSVQLNDVIGNFYNENEQVIVSFKSKKGNYDEKTKKVILDGENLFVSKDGSQLYADTIIWQGKDEDILAQGDIQFIQEGKIITKAQKAVFNSELTNFKVIGKTKTQLYAQDDIKKQYTKF